MKTSQDIIRSRHEAVSRSKTFARIRTTLCLEDKRVVDIGCGYGEYLVHFGEGSLGITTTQDEIRYGVESGIPIVEGNAESMDSLSIRDKFEVGWMNNLFEHLLSPHAFLINLRGHIRNDGEIVLGVPMVPAIPSLMKIRKWRGALASNHINFFTTRTLKLTVERAGWVYKDARPFIFTNVLLDRLAAPLAPHIYLIATKDESFKYAPKKRKEWEGQPYYENLLRAGS